MNRIGLPWTNINYRTIMKEVFSYCFFSLIPLGFMHMIFADGETIGIETGEDRDSICIVAFGNSITAERETVDSVFAQRLPSLLEEHGLSCRISNAGIGGSHTGHRRDSDLFQIQHALDRLQQDVLDLEPDLVIVGFGTNDAYIDSKKASGPSRITLKEFKKNLTHIIQSLQAIGSKVILIAPNCLGKNYPDFQNERLRKYVNVVRNLAKKFETGLLDNYALFVNYDQVPAQSMDDLMLDGIHPNDKGHILMAQGLSEIIINILSSKN